MKKLMIAAALVLTTAFLVTPGLSQVQIAQKGKCCLCSAGIDPNTGDPISTCPCNRRLGGNGCLIGTDGCQTVGDCIS